MATSKKKEEDKEIILLRELSILEGKVKEKLAEIKEYRISKRVENKPVSLAECVRVARRDDLNSDRRELKKVTAMAVDKLKKTR